MDDVIEFAKKYWVYIVAGVVVLLLITRGSGRSSGGSDMAAFYQAQAQAGVQNAQLGMQQQALQMEQDRDNRLFELERERLDVMKQTAQTQAMSDFISAQGEMAGMVGAGAGALVKSLYEPTIAAMQTASYENAAALEAGALVAVGGFQTQADIVREGSVTVGSVGESIKTWADVGSSSAQILSTRGAGQRQSPLQTIGQTATSIFDSYSRGGGFLSPVGLGSRW